MWNIANDMEMGYTDCALDPDAPYCDWMDYLSPEGENIENDLYNIPNEYAGTHDRWNCNNSWYRDNTTWADNYQDGGNPYWRAYLSNFTSYPLYDSTVQVRLFDSSNSDDMALMYWYGGNGTTPSCYSPDGSRWSC
jgi:hypothetical protein